MPKRRQAARELSVQRRSALNVRLFLRDFCSEFLENCYNRLMGSVKVRAWEGWNREVMGPVVGRSLWDADPGVWTSSWAGYRAPLRDGEDAGRDWVIGTILKRLREMPQREGRDLGRTREGWKF